MNKKLKEKNDTEFAEIMKKISRLDWTDSKRRRVEQMAKEEELQNKIEKLGKELRAAEQAYKQLRHKHMQQGVVVDASKKLCLDLKTTNEELKADLKIANQKLAESEDGIMVLKKSFKVLSGETWV